MITTVVHPVVPCFTTALAPLSLAVSTLISVTSTMANVLSAHCSSRRTFTTSLRVSRVAFEN
eukprot:1168311-Prymnesium_polylepis.1